MSTFFSFPAQVNEYAARTVATGVIILLTIAYVCHAPWILPVIATGFLLRVGWGPRFSPLARTAIAVAPKFFPVKPVSGPPKRFAQGVGAVFTVSASALWLAGYDTAAWSLAAVIVVFASLEAFLAFCMGCWVYARLQHAGLLPPDACVDCAPGLT